MKRRIQAARDAVVNRMLGIELGATIAALQESIERNAAWQAQTTEELAALLAQVEAQQMVMRLEFDESDRSRAQLERVRESAEYAAVFDNPDPLVSVRIATYRNTDALVDLALASVRAQTYDRWEAVVVNDGPNEATRRAVEGLRDDRIRFVELPERGKYPSATRSRWMVAGVPPANRAIDLVTGSWIAPLDDDDEFTPDHIERLLGLALERRVELMYGALVQRNLINGEEFRIYSDPPEAGAFSFQGSLHLSLLRFFKYDIRSWILGEPADWNLMRRMLEAGVRVSGVDEIVAVMNMVPYTHKRPDGSSSST